MPCLVLVPRGDCDGIGVTRVPRGDGPCARVFEYVHASMCARPLSALVWMCVF